MKTKTQTKRMNFRVDEITDSIIRQKAAQAGMSLSAFVIGSAVESKIVSFEALKPLTTELKRIGNNLNQLVVLVRLGKVQAANLDKTRQELAEIHRLMAGILKRG